MTELILIPEDWNAAEEVVARLAAPTTNRNELVATYAKKHAEWGDSRFRLFYGLRQPRNSREKWRLQFERGEISEDELITLNVDHGRRPVDLEISNSLYSELEERLGWLIQFWRSIVQRSRDFELGHAPSVSAAQRDRYLVECHQQCSLSLQQAEAVVSLAEQVRIERNLGLVAWGNITSASALVLFGTVRDQCRQYWENSQVVFNLGHHYDDLGRLLPPESFMKEAWQFHRFEDLRAFLRGEAAAVRLALADNAPLPPAPEIHVVNQVHVQPAAVTVNNLIPVVGNEPKGKPQPPKPDRPPLKHKLNLRMWAVGLEDGATWWLFHLGDHGWEQRGRVEIPTGKPHRILTAIAENQGVFGRDEALALYRPQYPGRSDADIIKQVRYGLTDVRRCIREAIAVAVEADVPRVIDPIPYIASAWRAEVQIGYAFQDDDRRLRFRCDRDE